MVREITAGAVQAAPPNRYGLTHHHPQKMQSFSGAEKVEVMTALIIEQTSTNISGKQNTLCQEPSVCIVYALCFVFFLYTTSWLVLMADAQFLLEHSQHGSRGLPGSLEQNPAHVPQDAGPHCETKYGE